MVSDTCAEEGGGEGGEERLETQVVSVTCVDGGTDR